MFVNMMPGISGLLGYKTGGLDGAAQQMGYENWAGVPKDGGFFGGAFSASDLGNVAGLGLLNNGLFSLASGTDALSGGQITSGLINGTLGGPDTPKTPGASEAVTQALGSNPYQTQGSFGHSPYNVMRSYYGGLQSPQQHQQHMQSIGSSVNAARNSNPMTNPGGLFGNAMNAMRSGIDYQRGLLGMNQPASQPQAPQPQTAQNQTSQSYRPEMGGMQQYQQQMGAPYMPGQQSQGSMPYGAGWGQVAPGKGGFSPPSVGGSFGGMVNAPQMGSNWVQQLLNGLNQAPSATQQPQAGTGAGGISFGPGANQYVDSSGTPALGGLSYDPGITAMIEAHNL